MEEEGDEREGGKRSRKKKMREEGEENDRGKGGREEGEGASYNLQGTEPTLML